MLLLMSAPLVLQVGMQQIMALLSVVSANLESSVLVEVRHAPVVPRDITNRTMVLHGVNFVVETWFPMSQRSFVIRLLMVIMSLKIPPKCSLSIFVRLYLLAMEVRFFFFPLLVSHHEKVLLSVDNNLISIYLSIYLK
jgi:hypothetical protein